MCFSPLLCEIFLLYFTSPPIIIKSMKKAFFSVILSLTTLCSLSQSVIKSNNKAGKHSSNLSIQYFGINYTLPFAHAYRAHKAMGIHHEEAIKADVYHFRRLGLNAFRVHIWDVEISDSAGNLLHNEHLRLFDFLLAELKRNDIKIMLTPIAFWNNGYPEPDEITPGFSTGMHKRDILRSEAKTLAQENYMRALVRHVNPYTGLSYADDPDIIAMEINNEPHHSGDPAQVTEYVNRLAGAARKAGWKKPVYYNISESPAYGEAVLKAKIDGVSFQWYPTGLVLGRSHRGNFYPNMSRYENPWEGHPLMKGKDLMVYEFDAGDLMSNYAYPAMAASFKNAGFFWATQFAYDPLYMAHVNTEYQTHYLNLAYTPSKAISLMIAAKLFRSPHTFPAFDTQNTYVPLTIHPEKDYSEWNDDTTFYYTGNTTSHPRNPAALKHIAGTGSSPLVQYQGTGAYFLDKTSEGWRLEIMPDAVPVKDPFEKASPSKTVTAIYHSSRSITFSPEHFGTTLQIIPLTENTGKAAAKVSANSFSLYPGVYLITHSGRQPSGLAELKKETVYYAPAENFPNTITRHHAPKLLAAGQEIPLQAIIAAPSEPDSVKLEWVGAGWNSFMAMAENTSNPYVYTATVPGKYVLPGLAQYRFWVYEKGKITCFPGGHEGNPHAWDYTGGEFYQTTVLGEKHFVPVFDAARDKNNFILYQPDWNNGRFEYSLNNKAETILQFRYTTNSDAESFGIELYCGDIRENFSGRKFEQLILEGLKANTDSILVTIIHTNGESYGYSFTPPPGESTVVLSIHDFSPREMLLLPRPYPGFQPLYYRHPQPSVPDFGKAERIQVIGKGKGMKDKEMQLKTVYLH
jgi:hypothetical protein